MDLYKFLLFKRWATSRTQINLKATTVNTLFGSGQVQITGTLTVVGLDSGARLTIPILINKTIV